MPPSPAKKRKLNGDPKTTAPTAKPRGLEYFFAKQRASAPNSSDNVSGTLDPQQDGPASAEDATMTDEQLARKLQAEWDKEIRDQSAGPTGDATPVDGSSSQPTPSPPKEDIPRESDLALRPETLQVPLSAGPGKKTLSLSSASATEDSISESVPFDQSPLTFDPSEHAAKLKDHWASEGGDASYALLTRCFVLVNGTTSRIKIVDTLVNCIRTLIETDPSSLLPAVWLATNSISPPYISLELGLGGSAISKALKQVCGLNNQTLKAIYSKHGDAGDVAFEAKKKQSFTLRKPKPLTIKAVYQSLVKIANSQGQGSNETKQRIVDRLLQDARGGEESRYIVRTLCQHLRIGAVKTTMLIALARAFLLSRPAGADFPLRSRAELSKLKKEELAEVWAKAEETTKACFARRPNYNDIVPTLLEVGVCDELLLRCGLALHIPLRPMLGSITRDLSEMLTKLQGRDFACEFKYDGQRAQIHCDEKGKVSIFSRHLELMTDKYPDLVALMPKIRAEGVESFIMEGEVVAIDRQTGDLKNFQTLTNRARKDVAIGSIQVDVCMFAFDLMFLNGQPLLDRPFRERRELLRSMFHEVPHTFTWVKSLDATSADADTVLDFFKAATDIKCEGIMVKILDNLAELPYQGGEPDQGGEEDATADSAKPKAKGGKPTDTKKKTRRKPLLATYEPDKRLDSWLKVKKDYSSSFDTLDMIPVAGWHGSGRKAKWWSPILMAVRNDESGALEVVCKCMSGFTDAFYKANREFYDNGGSGKVDDDGEPFTQNIRATKPAFVEYSGPEPDVWFEPQEVWEMAFADITMSPTYTAAIGLVSDERGLSLRFPRFLKKREDKSMEEASTVDFLAGLFRKQEAKAPQQAATEEADAELDEE
ncbi:DNA ligase I [Plectosphaerella plurivora]|uniref:DNA ligase n=1 Tax=Plectosphaerella plurivora TaxID=936078 RepID=A0A9P8VBB4_9PEZI|nr:DNA ligase I [Plectosphaerella plurivora]